jgi:hypothetical protein
MKSSKKNKIDITNFEFLSQLIVKGTVLLYKDDNFAEKIYLSNIPFRPGVYLVYSLNKEGKDQHLLYYGKAGVTNNSGTPKLNFHQLPERLLAATIIPEGYPGYDANIKKDITRAKLWPWYVKNIYKHGIKIYWFITEWPSQNPNDFEKKIKLELKQKYSKWQKSI